MLAGAAVKRRLGLGAWTRVAYNAFAALHLVGVLALGRALLGGAPAFALGQAVANFQGLMIGAGAVIFLWGLSGYDLARFAGTAQIRAARAGQTLAEDEPLRLDGAHRWVRHPLYAAGLLVVWGGVADPLGLATAVWASAYLLAGMVHEETSLLARHGQDYAAYRARVPALVPWRGRAI